MVNFSFKLEEATRELLSALFTPDEVESAISAIEHLLYQIDKKLLREELVKWLVSYMRREREILPEICSEERISFEGAKNIFKDLNDLTESEIKNALLHSWSFKDLERQTKLLSLETLIENPNIDNLQTAILP